MNRIATSFVLCLFQLTLYAYIRPSHIFSDNMVLQQNAKILVWGTASKGERVRVSFAGQNVSTTASKQGKWELYLSPMKASETPQDMVFRGKDTITIKNVLIGEVWFCAGQSNMEMPMGKFNIYRGAEGYEEELKDVNYPSIRLLQVPHYQSGIPLTDLNMGWMECTPKSVYWTSAVAYFFAKKINQEMHVPIGIINSAWGGSAIQSWTPPIAFKLVPGFEKELAQLRSADSLFKANNNDKNLPAWRASVEKYMDSVGMVEPSDAWLSRPRLPASGHPLNYPAPTTLFNAMVAPIIPFAIHGVLWYQGESNLGDGLFYTKRMEALIKGWRNLWGIGEFPFYFVQIAPFTYRDWPVKNATPDMLPRLWEAQKAALSIPNTAMVQTEDLGELNDIHPIKKREIGERLADLLMTSLQGSKR